ncbi:aminotransferase class I/II-fold pyridoxal phosphate-dependent enzyme [Yeosuana sp. MJ-SS3]|uniref:Aminotransferase class I/II-fold pyridoxal phosphate-dependent enzyme n=1 Tax=Gilvirhabdus luticola TaxID=3079858 RepID=A0ABU3U736_9FLAO|nr:DegT/DnrJ/EryC1/StrS family aminotransferase [Yeosuana sp. MJ-SS3]MDU8886152.1 aminotransferase class I/II-fold pyridoxal phosphate-dependent enzyme [Yeosuana sp. MJ-SS3]
MKNKISALKSKIWLSPPHMSGYEQEFIDEAFKTNWIAPLGPNVIGFEKDIELYLNHNSHAVALSSGTAAIHLALILLNVGCGDEVICQTKTFAASVYPVIYQGAKPIFIDSEKKTWNICPELLEKAIKERVALNKKPKAIIAINLYGMPYNVEAINRISKTYAIPVIEDSAEAIGGSYNNIKCGTFGDYSVFSFNGNKIITTSGGGVLITRNKEDKEKAVFLATQAKEKGAEYSHSTIGYNYRLSNILAGIGRGQMKVLDERVNLRRRNFNFYYEHLGTYKNISFLKEPKGYSSNRWLTCVVFKSKKVREEIRLLLEKENIESRPSWKPMHLQPVFNTFPSYLNGTSDELYEKGLCLPSGSNLTLDDLSRIVKIIKSYFEQ